MADDTSILPADQNFYRAAGFESDSTAGLVLAGQIDEITGRILVDNASASGTVTSVSVVSANGFAGSVATATTTPAITLSTTITGILKGNGTAISAITVGSGLSYDGTTLSATGGGAATEITVANEATDTTCFPVFVTAATGDLAPKSNAGLTFNSNTGNLGATILSSSSLTASEIVITDASKNLVSAAVATYPSLTELTYLKGVTSAVQTQLNAKLALAGGTMTGALILDDTSFQIQEGADTLTLTVPVLTASRAITFGDFAGQITINEATQTLTNKTLTSPILTTPALGTPASGVLTNCTGLPTAGLVDDAVTLAKMAPGTDGNLITYDTNGDPAYVATGTAGQVLTSNGVGTAPTFQTPSSGGGDNVVFVPAGAFVPGTSCTLTPAGTTAWIPVASFADGATGRATISVKVPKGCNGITSIEVIYQNTVASTLQLYLEYEMASLNLDSLPSAVNSDTGAGAAQYASDSTSGNIAKVTVPSSSYNGLTNVDADDLITIRINREGGNANDTYNTAWEVIGVVFTFTAV